jgi:hypothetical protein
MRLDLTPKFVADNFATILTRKRCHLGRVLVELVCGGIAQELSDSAANGFTVDLKFIPPTADCHVPWTTYAELAAGHDYSFWYLTVVLSTAKDLVLTRENIRLPHHMRWLPIGYGRGVEERFKVKSTSLKTKHKLLIEILNPCVPARLVTDNVKMNGSCKCSPEDLAPVPSSVWNWWLEFGCRICGRTYICECFRSAIELHVREARARLQKQPGGTMDRSFMDATSRSRFRDGICHICTGTPSDLMFCSPMYGSPIKVKYGHHIRKLEIAEGIDEREAENRVRDMLDVPRIGEGWIGETQLHRAICLLLPECQVLREASPPWLGRQRLDIYVPDLRLAIEYQGQQHFSAVEHFGGEEGLAETLRRDRKKRSLCKANGVDLLHFKFDENSGFDAVAKRLNAFLQRKRGDGRDGSP